MVWENANLTRFGERRSTERKERLAMLKYASKLLLNILISVLATVVGSYMANQYVARRSVANAPVAPAVATVDPRKVDAAAASSEPVQDVVTISEEPAEAVGALEPAGGGRVVDTANDEKAAPTVGKPAEPTRLRVRVPRSRPDVMKRSSSQRTRVANEGPSSRRPEPKKADSMALR